MGDKDKIETKPIPTTPTTSGSNIPINPVPNLSTYTKSKQNK